MQHLDLPVLEDAADAAVEAGAREHGGDGVSQVQRGPHHRRHVLSGGHSAASAGLAAHVVTQAAGGLRDPVRACLPEGRTCVPFPRQNKAVGKRPRGWGLWAVNAVVQAACLEAAPKGTSPTPGVDGVWSVGSGSSCPGLRPGACSCPSPGAHSGRCVDLVGGHVLLGTGTQDGVGPSPSLPQSARPCARGPRDKPWGPHAHPLPRSGGGHRPRGPLGYRGPKLPGVPTGTRQAGGRGEARDRLSLRMSTASPVAAALSGCPS